MCYNLQHNTVKHLNYSLCICVGVFYPTTTTWGEKKRIDILQNASGESWRNTHAHTQMYNSSSILLILCSGAQWHSVPLFIHHSEGLNCINEHEKTGLCHFCSLKPDSKPMGRNVAEDHCADTVHNSFTARFMSKWFTTEKHTLFQDETEGIKGFL